MGTSAAPTSLRLPFASRISGIGSAFPSRRVTNDDLSKLVDTNDAWITERTGIKERRLVTPGDPNETNSALALAASKRALEMAGKRPEDIDGIFYGTFSPDTLVPGAGCWLQKKLGAANAFAFDLNSACSGFIYALSVADQFIKTGQIKTALVIGSDVTSTYVNWEDRTSCILFGDGAGVAVLEACPSDSRNRVLSTHLHSDGTLWDLFYMPAGGSAMEVTPEVKAQKLDKMQMKGKEIFKVAVRTLCDFAQRALDANGIKISEVDWFVPHQANLRIIEAVAKRLEVPLEKVLINIDRFGNTSAATAPTALDEAVRDGRVKPGDLVLIDVFGAGLTYGSALVRWG